MTCKIETVQSQFCEIRGDPADGDLCGHSPEDFAEAQLMLEPRGLAWCKKYTTTKAAIYRAAGAIFSDFEQRICDLFRESLACDWLNYWASGRLSTDSQSPAISAHTRLI